MAAAFLIEFLLTGLLVLTILGATDLKAPVGFAGLAIGAVLVVIHLVSIPVTNTSVNPARSIGPALFAGGAAMHQLWLFVAAPLLGGAAAALLYRLIRALDPTLQMPQRQRCRRSSARPHSAWTGRRQADRVLIASRFRPRPSSDLGKADARRGRASATDPSRGREWCTDTKLRRNRPARDPFMRRRNMAGGGAAVTIRLPDTPPSS